MTLRVKMEGMQYTKHRPTTMLAIKTMRKTFFYGSHEKRVLERKKRKTFIYPLLLLRITALVSLLEILIQTIMHAKMY